jgi:hypothetical protein
MTDLLEATGLALLNLEYFLYLPERLFNRFSAFERMVSRLPLGGQYALLAQAPL